MHRYLWKWRLADLREPSEDAPTVFSTFACGGGSSMGYKRAGFRVVGNCEIDPKMAEVYEANLHPERSYVMDLRKFNELDELPEELYGLDVLDGSPPCSTFSTAGLRDKAWGIEKKFAEGQEKQRLDDLFFTYLDTVEKLKPKAFVAENVTGLIKGNAKGYVNEIIKRARQIGYSVQLFSLNAAFMGVPQRRERVFFIGNRMGWPKLRLDFDEELVTFGEVRGDKPGKELSEQDLQWVKRARRYEASIYHTATKAGVKMGRFSSVYCWDERPAPTLTATEGAIRMCDKTRITEEDARNVQSFPQDYDFQGKSANYICGMSVPPSMMANIAREIKEQWLDVRESQS